MRKDERSIEDLAREALSVQDACNLSGVVLAFGRAVLRLRELLEADGKAGTTAVNRHAICVLWADKIQSLTGAGFSSAYRWAADLVEHAEERKRLAEVQAEALLCVGCGGRVDMMGDDLCPACAGNTQAAE